MFTLLPPGSRLGAHRDPFAGSLRYHLGLSTPNSPDCYIIVDGQKYHWRDGEAVMFDETYIHQAENRTGNCSVHCRHFHRPWRSHRHQPRDSFLRHRAAAI